MMKAFCPHTGLTRAGQVMALAWRICEESETCQIIPMINKTAKHRKKCVIFLFPDDINVIGFRWAG